MSAASVFLILCGSFSVNDYYDREADAVNTPWRPIPLGAVTPTAALTFGMSLLACGLLLSLLTLSAVRAGLGVIFVTGSLAYSPWIKRITLLKNAWVAFLCSLLPLAGEGDFGKLPEQSMLLIFAFVFQKELAADLLDAKGDDQERLRTMAISVGRTPVVLLLIMSNLALSAVLAMDSSLGPIARGGSLALTGINLVLSSALLRSRSRKFLWFYVRLQYLILISGFIHFFPEDLGGTGDRYG